nr:hypothetical protein [Saccharolobus solfataricus]
MDVLAVYEVAKEAVDKAEKEEVPSLLHCKDLQSFLDTLRRFFSF